MLFSRLYNLALLAATATAATYWQPESSTSWDIQLISVPDPAGVKDLASFDLDLFDTPASTVAALQDKGIKVICYFSAGTYEDWRPDAGMFQDSDKGKNLSEWRGEKWLATNSDNVRSIMALRMDMARDKGCDAVDPDNMDAYGNDNGLGLIGDDAIAYVRYLADLAHERGLAMGLKNAGSILSAVIDVVQFSVQEQCHQYGDCSTYQLFIQQNKPVFEIEYPKGDINSNDNVSSTMYDDICNSADNTGFTKVIKNMNLDAWVQPCPVTVNNRRLSRVFRYGMKN